MMSLWRLKERFMAYTVKQLSEVSGVSVRTLHWYDLKGLLKPAYVGDNGYRYYEEEQVLLLQQVLFFRELGFKLGDIGKVLARDDFDKASALKLHKQTLLKDIDRKKQLVSTIEKTILHLGEKKVIKDKELYAGFENMTETELENMSQEDKLAFVKKFPADFASWGKEEWKKHLSDADVIYKDLEIAIEAELNEVSEEVQKIIHRHFLHGCEIDPHGMNKAGYLSLADTYMGKFPDSFENFPNMRKKHSAGMDVFFQKYHPKMLEFLVKGMRFYADKNLS
jgi:DNA-binding transcriptional MerR regulator